MIVVDFEAIADGTNDELVKACERGLSAQLPCPPRVGDLVNFESQGRSYTVKTVFWRIDEGTVLVRLR